MPLSGTFPGGSSPAEAGSWVGDAGQTYSVFTVPAGRAMFNGDDRVLLTGATLYVSGRGASRSVNGILGGALAAAQTVPAAGSAQARSWAFGLLREPGSAQTYGVQANGSIYFGRSLSGGTVTQPGGSTRAGQLSGTYAYAKAPTAPRSPAATGLGPTRIRVNWTAPSDYGGGTVAGYAIQRSSSPSMSSPTTVEVGNVASYEFTNLAPGTYYFRVMCRTNVTEAANTYGVATAVVSAATLGSAPRALEISLVDPDSVRVSWTEPLDLTGVTAYRVQRATNAGFTENLETHTVPLSELEKQLDGLAPGVTYQIRVTSMSGSSAGSSVAGTFFVPSSSGDLDGWANVGVVSGIYGLTVERLRRSSLTGIPNVLLREQNASSATGVTDGAIAIERTVTGLTIGRSYRLRARMRSTFPTAPGAAQAKTYRLVAGGIVGDPATLSGSSDVTLPPVEFVASSETQTIRIELAQTIGSIPAGTLVERVAFHTIRLEQLGSIVPYRLRSTLRESSLADHFDLVGASTGSQWFVDAAGVTQFILPGTERPVVATFTDERTEGELEYVEIEAGYDTRTLVNAITGTNLGVQLDPENPANLITLEDPIEAIDAQAASIWGERSEEIELNLYDEGAFAGSVENRLEELLEGHSAPTLLISSITWNAQEKWELLTELELGSRVLVRFKGKTQDSTIVGISHKSSPRRWLATYTLVPRGEIA